MSKNAKHTPGPWPYERTEDGKRIIIGDGLVEGPNGYEVAEVYSDDCDYGEALANARLIAAAPGLLDALQELYEHTCQHPTGASGWNAVLNKTEAAIRKATGDAP